jgi:hypothetical protein
MPLERVGGRRLTLPEEQHGEVSSRQQGGHAERAERAAEHDDVVVAIGHRRES